MAEIIHSIRECAPVPSTDRMRLTFAGESGEHSFELTREALEALLPELLARPHAPGQSMTVANAVSPVGCAPFESTQGLCGLAFNLGDRSLHVAVPPSGIETVRGALRAIESLYNQKLPR